MVKREDPDHIWTHERRYWYRNEGINSDPRDPDDGPSAERRRIHGHQTVIGCPASGPRHTTRSHFERDGDVARADLDPDVRADPYTINTRDSVGAVDMMATGLERQVATNERLNDGLNWIAHETYRTSLSEHEGDCDPMEPDQFQV